MNHSRFNARTPLLGRGVGWPLFFFGVLVFVAFFYKGNQPKVSNEQSISPTFVPTQSSVAVHTSLTPSPTRALPTGPIHSKVPFTSQAPYANWDETRKEACEEASALMVGRYFRGDREDTIDPADADKAILEMVEWQTANFGDHFDLTLEQEQQLITAFYPDLHSEIVAASAQRIVEDLHQGNLVIIPAAGQALGNPYFRAPGPIYHMLVVIGVRGTKFITNDPGTKRGKDYLYDQKTLLGAVHEWTGDPATINNGRAVMLVVGKGVE